MRSPNGLPETVTATDQPARALPRTFAQECIEQLRLVAARARPPRVKALHLPPDPVAGEARGEFCALELADGTLGLSYVLLDDTLSRLRDADPTLGLAGADALALAHRFAEGQGFHRAVGLAAVNALTRWFFDRSGFVPEESADSIGALQPTRGEHLGMIGLFTPLLPRVLATGVRLTVVELKPDLVGQFDGYRVTLDAAALLECDKVLSTGTLLLNDTLDAMLAQCRRARAIALIGPSVGCVPDGLFARGVTFLGGTWVSDNRAYLDMLRQGSARGAAARKFGLTPAGYPGFEQLLMRLT
jgi:uncharacterized protein (DUF4213/DUF364 family)